DWMACGELTLETRIDVKLSRTHECGQEDDGSGRDDGAWPSRDDSRDVGERRFKGASAACLQRHVARLRCWEHGAHGRGERELDRRRGRNAKPRQKTKCAYGRGEKEGRRGER